MASYEVERPDGSTVHFNDIREASALAISVALSGRDATLDVLIYDEDDARRYGGDDAVERYRDDPDASVFDRIIIRAESLGMVP